MAKQAKYYLCLRQSDVVGPYAFDKLREWLLVGAIDSEQQVCKEGEETWLALNKIPRSDSPTAQIRERIERGRKARAKWGKEPVTPKQLAKLAFFDLPFDASKLTKGSASELIDCFTSIDPQREKAYQNRPATPEQIKELRDRDLKSIGVTYGEAKSLIAQADFEKALAEDKDLEETDEEMDLFMLDHEINDSDTMEIFNYRELSTARLRKLLKFLNKELPGWREMSRWDYAKIVPQVFPELSTNRNSAKREGAKGGVSIPAWAVVLIFIILALIALLGK